MSFIDKLDRPLQDMRISVTDRCNFRCTYCMPKEVFGPGYKFLPKNELLNFEEITRQLIDSSAALRIQNTVELEEAVRHLFNDPELRDRMGQAGLSLVRSGQGALERTLEIVDGLLIPAAD